MINIKKLKYLWGGFKMEEYYCPDCTNELEALKGWGSVSYFCKVCNSLKSRKRILTKKQMEEVKKEKEE